MSSDILVKYPLDLTGTSPTNLVIDEIHVIGSLDKRAIVPNAGPFYADTMVIVNNATGQRLVPVLDYVLVQPYEEATLASGLEVESIIWINDPITNADLALTYQVVGGEFSWSVYALVEMINTLNLDNRPVAWGDILGKPNAYPPTPHLHDLGDTYGWEYITQMLEGIRMAILTGDDASHEELRSQMQTLADQLSAQMLALQNTFGGHVQDLTNPHQTTKAQVGLGQVANYPVATDLEAQAGTANDRYMTPYLTALLVNKIAGTALGGHLSDFANPHQVTKAQVGLAAVENYPIASTVEAQLGQAPDRYMTALRVAEAITAQVGNAFSQHASNYTNPHQVTKAQVGLGSVQNYATASDADAAQGTSSILYVTPTGVKAAVNVHANRVDNPHNTTKAQVGLGSVENYPPATVTEAQGGTATNRYMTPALTASAIAALAIRKSGGTMSGTLSFDGVSDFLRSVVGSYGTMLRNDGTNLYLLLTNANDQWGSWNALRPLTVNLASGKADISGNAATASRVRNGLDAGGTSAITFNWSGLGGQPTWLWGGETMDDIRLYNPANFSVNRAATAGYADNVSVAAVQAAYAAIPFDGIGAYGWFVLSYRASVSPGQTAPGSTLHWYGGRGSTSRGTPPPGTWMLEGSTQNSDGDDSDSTTLCRRIL